MIKKLVYTITMAVLFLSSLGVPKQVFAADVCWNQRTISMHICEAGALSCTEYISPCIGTAIFGSAFATVVDGVIQIAANANAARDDCVSKCFIGGSSGPYPTPVTSGDPGTCGAPYCATYLTPYFCQAETYIAQCIHVYQPVETCNAELNVSSCEGQATGDTCIDNPATTYTWGCWGPGPTATPTPEGISVPTSTPGGTCGNGVCDAGETCVTCPQDCTCPPTDTPTETPTGMPLCGNGSCDDLVGENCINCPADCGVCPTSTPTVTPTPTPEPGILRIRGWRVTSDEVSCPVDTSHGPVIGTQFSFSPALSPSSQTQTGSSYLEWDNVPPETSYTLTNAPPTGNILKSVCFQRTVTTPLTGTDIASWVAGGETVEWDLGYSEGEQWAQVDGGDVTAGTVQSYVPIGASPREFVVDGSGGYPGVVTYTNTYNFDSTNVTKGEGWVSSKNWLVNDKLPTTTDYYHLLYTQMNSPTTVSSGNTAALTDPGSGVYYYQGPVTITSPWTIGSGESVVVFIDNTPGHTDASLTINNTINIVPGGFLAFIVNGNISVAPSVGEVYTTYPPTPVVEGVYVTSPSGTFDTGDSSVAGHERFVGDGIFVAGNFNLNRNVGDAGNPTTSSELFIYNPRLLFTMPAVMKQMSVNWQEAAP